MQLFKRKITRTVYVGQVPIGGGFPITVQSMTNVKTHQLATLIPQIERLESAGCQLIRVAVPDEQAVKALPEIKKRMQVPLIADIHFDYRLALAAIDAGADKIRINPGNIGGKERIRMVLQKAKAAQIPIRVGVNAGSLEKDLLEKFGGPTAEALVASAGRQIELCRENDFENVVVALKAATVPLMIKAYRLFAEQYDYPLHLGVTEAGPLHQGTIASCIGIGTLLAEGIGDTLRVSLTADPVEEVRLGLQILQMLELNPGGVRLVSCPTCGRTTVDLIPMVEEVADFVKDLKRHLTVAVMGCEVNGPGEAREADLGLAFGRGQAVLFRRGKIFARLTPRAALERLKEEIINWQAEPDKEE
jgi:(E)-4-hydroxy-3-methylbut-2-enyl-diphosphate synthase